MSLFKKLFSNAKAEAPADSPSGELNLAQALRMHLDGNLNGALDAYGQLRAERPADILSQLLGAAASGQRDGAAVTAALVATLRRPPFPQGTSLSDAVLDELLPLTERGPLADKKAALSELLFSLGDALKKGGGHEDCIPFFEIAVGIAPENADFRYRLGDSLHDLRRYENAASALQGAMQCDRNHWGAIYTYAVLLQDLGRHADAIVYYERALSLNDHHAKSHSNLGSALFNVSRFEDALIQSQKAIALDPALGPPHVIAGTIAYNQGDYREAAAYLERALQLSPSAGTAVKLMLVTPVIPESRQVMEEYRARMINLMRSLRAQGLRLSDPVREVGITPFYLAYQGMDNLPIMRELAQFYLEACPRLGHQAQHCLNGSSPRVSGRKIRIGFVSSFFYDHTIGRFFNQIIRRISRDTFHVMAFSLFGNPDEISAAIRGEADEAHALPMDLVGAQQVIENTRPDVLVYADIGMEPLTYFLAMGRLAPVQIALYGHPDSTGIPNVDYFLSHVDCETADAATHYSEELLCLSNKVAYTYFDRPQPPESPMSREDFDLDAEAHLYICPQSLFKIHLDLDELFAKILRRDPKGTILLTQGVNPHWVELLNKRHRQSLPDVADRIRFLPKVSRQHFLELLRLSDVALDTLHFSGGNTTLDTFAVGTPIVTLPGQFMRGRQTLACYRRLEMMDCVVQDGEAYVELALTIASDQALRARLQATILERGGRLFADAGMIAEFEEQVLSLVH